MAGLGLNGFTPKTLDEIQEDIFARMRSKWGDGIDTTANSNFGMLGGIIAEIASELWDVAQAVYAAAYPSSATGMSLREVSEITGTQAKEATKSAVTLTATGTPGTLIAQGRVFSVAGSGHRFVSLADATIGGGGTVSIEAEAEETGAIPANAGTLTVIETPVAGLSSVTNPLDAVLGTSEDTDPELRRRRDSELHQRGLGSVPAIVSAVSNAFPEEVEAVSGYENTGDTTNSDGLPPHSFEILAVGGDDAELAEVILASKPAGIATHGTESETVTDSEGTPHLVKFSRASTIDIHVRAEVLANPTLFPADGAAQIRDLIVAFGDALPLAHDVISAALVAQCFQVPGVLDATVFIDDAASPATTATVVMGLRQIPEFDTSRTTVNVTFGAP